MSDPPIDPLDYISGVKVVDIGDLRVARGLSRRHTSSCPHRRLHYDNAERRIWCADCETNIEAFDAFEILTSNYARAYDGLVQKKKDIEAAEQQSIRSLAAKAVDKVWRSKNAVPACPHCGNGLFPEHFKNGCTYIGADYAKAKLEREKKP